MTERSPDIESKLASQLPVTFKKRNAKATRKRAATTPDNDLSSSSEDEIHRIKRRRNVATSLLASSETKNTSEVDTLGAAHAAHPGMTVSGLSGTNDTSLPTNISASGKAPSRETNLSRDAAKSSPPYSEISSPTLTQTLGPVRAPSNVRMTTTTDYQPDICKDYKKTGFCGFGDTCKFLHTRDEYQQSWQLDKEWESASKGKNASSEEAVDKVGRETKAQGNIPFVCLICNGPYQSQIVTTCGHFFCRPCALKRYRRDPTCALCGAATGGIFNATGKSKKSAA